LGYRPDFWPATLQEYADVIEAMPLVEPYAPVKRFRVEPFRRIP
jgi:hypothetical protein